MTLVAHAAALYTGFIEPPRPMYSNVYFVQERDDLFASWDDSESCLDSEGNLLWVDHHDNAVLLFVSPAETTTPRLRRGLRSSVVELGMLGDRITIERTKNTLVVVRADGQSATFPIAQDVVVFEHFLALTGPCGTFPTKLSHLLAAEKRGKFDLFVVGSRVNEES